MAGTAGTTFFAADSALAYLYQVRVALLWPLSRKAGGVCRVPRSRPSTA